MASESRKQMRYEFPFPRFEKFLARICTLVYFRKKFKHFGSHSFVSPFVVITNLDCISIGRGTRICKGVEMYAISSYQDQCFSPEISIGDDVRIGRNCVIAATAHLSIGNQTTVGNCAYIAGGRHAYEDTTQGVLTQPLVEGSVKIGQRVWIGHGAFIASVGDIEIGDNVVIAANSVVTKSVPSFTVVAGVPAKAVKRYDERERAWVRVA